MSSICVWGCSCDDRYTRDWFLPQTRFKYTALIRTVAKWSITDPLCAIAYVKSIFNPNPPLKLG